LEFCFDYRLAKKGCAFLFPADSSAFWIHTSLVNLGGKSKIGKNLSFAKSLPNEVQMLDSTF
jgi:hypothetical protein